VKRCRSLDRQHRFVSGLLNDAGSSSDYIVSNVRMVSEWWTVEGVEGSGRAVLSAAREWLRKSLGGVACPWSGMWSPGSDHIRNRSANQWTRCKGMNGWGSCDKPWLFGLHLAVCLSVSKYQLWWWKYKNCRCKPQSLPAGLSVYLQAGAELCSDCTETYVILPSVRYTVDN
jgi:hypothetical protein